MWMHQKQSKFGTHRVIVLGMFDDISVAVGIEVVQQEFPKTNVRTASWRSIA